MGRDDGLDEGRAGGWVRVGKLRVLGSCKNKDNDVRSIPLSFRRKCAQPQGRTHLDSLDPVLRPLCTVVVIVRLLCPAQPSDLVGDHMQGVRASGWVGMKVSECQAE